MNLLGKLTEVKHVIQRIEQLPYQLRIEQGSVQSIDTNSASADIIIIATKKKP
jgi:galactitol-specific phosphotransferase system IIB component